MTSVRHVDCERISTGAAGPDEVLAFPASLAQSRYWTLDRLSPGNPAYNIAVRFRFTGELDSSLLERACNAILERHEVLRTTFALMDGQVMQVVAPSMEIQVPVTDLPRLPESERDAELDRLSLEEARRGFDITADPLFRASLIRLDTTEHVLLLTVHHSVADYWSIGIILSELGALYEGYKRGAEVRLPELPIQYADFTVWQREALASQARNEHLAYWKNQLRGLQALEFPTDRPRCTPPTFHSDIVSFVLPKSLTNAVREVGVGEGATFFHTMLAALNVLLHRYTGQTDIAVGTQIAGRDRVELENLVGCFINTLVLRTNLSEDPGFPELLSRVRDMMLDAVRHQDARFENLLEALGFAGDPSAHGLFRVNFICQRDEIRPAAFSSVELTVLPSKSQGALYELNVFLIERPDGWRLSCEYNTDLFGTPSIVRLLRNYAKVLEGIAENPKRRLSELLALEGADALARV